MSTMPADIARLKAEWDRLQPLKPDDERRLWQKLRLEWNYHSNHIEGNTLTYGETELLLLHDQTHGSHDIREFVEMKAHDVGIGHLCKLAADHTRIIGEGDIRDLNKIILKEPFWKPTETLDGRPTRKEIIPGEYKTTPNNVRTATGEIFEFAPPVDVPARMRSLVEWLEQALRNVPEDIAPVAAKLHHDFVLIHPFDDGNGRVARMLVNYVLLRTAYPPILIPTEDKKQYLTSLRLADAGDIRELENYLRARVGVGLELAIRAGKGESIEEPGDIEKEIAIFVRSQEHHRDKVQPRSPMAIKQLFDLGFKRLFERLVDKVKVFDPLFVQTNLIAKPPSPAGATDPIGCFEHQLSQGFKKTNFQLQVQLKGYRGEARQPFDLQRVLVLNFGEFNYVVEINGQTAAQKLYSEPLLSDETDHIVRSFLESIFKEIKKHSGAE